MTTADYVSKYLALLSKLHNDQRALAPLKVSILCSQHNQSSLLDENESTNTENYCQHCLTPWKYGHFVMKTHPNRKNKNDKIQKKRSTKLFNMVIKCFVCLNTTSSVYKKNIILNQKPTEKLLKSSTVNKSIEKTSKTEEKVETIVSKKPKKKKRTLYAGLNPLVFKNLNKKH
ncbi:unnamed protein product [Macrosiphum euphorbiae]|uniref:Uncharacterized protein n=1 Tax=Macrosiphum euphorbiae TaxID=13131 RepID=A0AAV0WS13_9HEMI|nr:unnamed protein product [Macrosiphum euphorbiae]